jgi:hypothetical protein
LPLEPADHDEQLTIPDKKLTAFQSDCCLLAAAKSIERGPEGPKEIPTDRLRKLDIKLADEMTELSIPLEDLRDLEDYFAASASARDAIIPNGLINSTELAKVVDVQRMARGRKKLNEEEVAQLNKSDDLVQPNITMEGSHVGFRDLLNATRFWKATQMMGTRKSNCFWHQDERRRGRRQPPPSISSEPT